MCELYKLTLTEAAAKLQAGEIKSRELVSDCLARIEMTEPDVQACLTVLADQALDEAAALDRSGPDPARPLWGLPLALKDLFLTRGVRTTAASRMLENYLPAYDAQVVTRLKEAGAVILAKTNLDEFAMGSSTEFSAFGPSRNPWNTAKVPGGSSGGAAASLAAYQTPGGFGTDTGGSLRQPAALCGCVGLKPTYGRISRYGIMALASSMDQAGPMARRVRDCALLLAAVAGPDERDAACSTRPADDYASAEPLPRRGLRLALPRELWESGLDSEVADVLNPAVKKLEEAGVEIQWHGLPSLKYATAAYQVLASAEGSTNMARFDGVRYGRRAENPRDLNELYFNSRSAWLGPEVKRRILLGTLVLSADYYEAYYRRAAQVRRLIRDDCLRLLEGCDFILTPTTSRTAWDFGRFADNPEAAFNFDRLTLPANLAGLPALSLPAGRGAAEGLPVGWQLIGKAFDEKNLLSAGLALEEMFPPLL